MKISILFSLLIAAAVSGAAAPRPNIVIILCDDLGYADVGFNGSPDIITPAIDTLAKNGIVCTSGYLAHSICGPSRAALLTGIYPQRFGGQYNIPSYHPQFGVPVERPMLSEILRQSGYRTAIIGKWHLGEGPAFHPNRRGFDEFYGFLGSGHKYFPEQYRAALKRELAAGKTQPSPNLLPLEHNGRPVHETEYLTDAFTREAVSFIERHAKRNEERSTRNKEPFFLYLAYNAPHAPNEARKDDMAAFPNIKDKKRRTLAGMVRAIDRGVGKVTAALKAAGAFDNTLILFLSDNGGKAGGPMNNAPLRGGKRGVEEGGIRVPMFFHWPREISRGRRYDHPVLTLDFFPTLLKLAGAPAPDLQLDGKDIWTDLIAGNNAHRGDPIYCISHHKDRTEVSGILDGWKVLRIRQRPWELHYLPDDISERNDLSREHPEKVRRMVQRIKAWADTHEQPKWFYFQEEYSKIWRNIKQPYFPGTFQ